MKKLLFASFLIMLAVISTGCRHEEPVPTPTAAKVINLTIESSQWSYSGVDNNNYFYAVFSMPEITWDVYDNGNVMVYREYFPKTDKASQTPLPYVRPKEEYIAEADQWVFYTETVDYEYTQGQLTIFYTASDFDYELNTAWIPETMTFRVYVMY